VAAGFATVVLLLRDENLAKLAVSAVGLVKLVELV